MKTSSKQELILGQFVPYVRSQNRNPTGDWFGSQVATNDLVEAALQYEAVDAVHFFERSRPRHPDADDAFSELKHRFGESRIARFPKHTLPTMVSRQNYVLLTHGLDYPQLGQARLSLSSGNFPVSSLIHSIDSPTMLMSYLSAYVYSEPYDTIIATSSAGASAVRALWMDAEELLKIQLGPVKRQMPEIEKIPLGVNVDYLIPGNKSQARYRLGLPGNRTIILYCGRLDEAEKADLNPLITCLTRLRLKFPTVHLLLCGKDVNETYSSVLRKRIADENLQSLVTIVSNFPYAMKRDIYSCADIFVSPVDNVQETFGIAIVEAMACGLPTVASDWSGYRDLIVDGETGFTVPTLWNPDDVWRASFWGPLADSPLARHLIAQHTVIDVDCLENRLSTLIANRDLRLAFGAAARARAVSMFSWNVVIKKLQLLWHDQSIKASASARSYFVQDYSQIFQDYPSLTIKPTVKLTRTDSQLHAFSGAPPNLKESAIHLLQQIDDHGYTLCDSDAATWLWKMGLLRHSSKTRGSEAGNAGNVHYRALNVTVRDAGELIAKIVLSHADSLSTRSQFMHIGASDGYITERVGRRFRATVAFEEDRDLIVALKARPLDKLSVNEFYSFNGLDNEKFDLILVGPLNEKVNPMLPVWIDSFVRNLSCDGILISVSGPHGGSLYEALMIARYGTAGDIDLRNGIKHDAAAIVASHFATEELSMPVEILYDRPEDAYDAMSSAVIDIDQRDVSPCKSELLEYLENHQADGFCVLNSEYSFLIARPQHQV